MTLNSTIPSLLQPVYQPSVAPPVLGAISLPNDATILRPPTLVVASPEGDNPLTDDADTGSETGAKKKQRRGRPAKSTSNKENEA